MRPKPPPRYRILVMMATNMPDALDEAMLRPGRIDRIYKVGYPTKDGRVRTYEGYLDKVRHELTPDDIDKLATMTPYATGARIKDTVNEALINAIRDGREVITWTDIVKAKQMKEHGLADDFRYVEHERQRSPCTRRATPSPVGLLCGHRMIDVATIERRGDVGGFVRTCRRKTGSPTGAASTTPTSRCRSHRWRASGCCSRATTRAASAATCATPPGSPRLMIGYWGMGNTFTSHAVRRSSGSVVAGAAAAAGRGR
ncbi:MAG: hypothetical protein R2713_23840 [Ilumatobacteraceae bacterium]